jgi:hypothetical protein
MDNGMGFQESDINISHTPPYPTILARLALSFRLQHGRGVDPAVPGLGTNRHQTPSDQNWSGYVDESVLIPIADFDLQIPISNSKRH